MKLSNSMRHVAVCLLSSACSITAGGVLAQEATSEVNAQSGTVLEELVVTARKREESLKDVPITVEALSGDDLFEAGHDNLNDMLKGVSNVNFSSDSTTRANFAVRGIGPDVSGIQGPGVGFFIDGIYQTSTAQLNTPFFDLERVELLKGPQGTLYGRNSLGGAVNFITPKPGNEFNASVGAELSSFDTVGVSGALGGALVEDSLYGRVSVQVRESDGPYTNRLNGEPAYPLESKQARGRLVWDATDNLEFDLIANYSEIEGTSFIYSQIDNLQNLSDNYAGDPESRSDIDAVDVALIATYAFEGFDLRSQTSHHSQEWDYAVDADTGPAFSLRVTNPAEFDVFSQEFRLISSSDSALQWLIGAEYAKIEVDSENNTFGPFIDFVTMVPGAGIGSVTTQERELFAAFADLTYELNDRVELGFGVRYDDVESTLTGENTFNVAGATILSTPFPDAIIEQDEWQPKATVTVDWTDSLTTFAVASRGFREGGFNQLAAGTPLESWTGDSAWNYELGLRWDAPNGRANFEASVFYIDWEDSTGSVLFGLGSTGVLNLGDAESTGLELSGTYLATDYLTLSAAGAVLDCEYKEITLPVGLVAQGLFEGDQCLFSSDWNFSVGADVVYPLGNSDYDLTANLSVLGRGDTRVGLHTTNDTSRTIQEAYYLTNLSIGVQNDQYSVIFFANNLTDEQYAVSTGTQENGALFGQQSDIAILGAPRSYGVRVKANF